MQTPLEPQAYLDARNAIPNESSGINSSETHALSCPHILCDRQKALDFIVLHSNLQCFGEAEDAQGGALCANGSSTISSQDIVGGEGLRNGPQTTDHDITFLDSRCN